MRRWCQRPSRSRKPRASLRPDELRALLARVRRGVVTPAAAARAIAEAPIEQLDFATIDHQRALRTGVPEVVFGPGKSVPDLVAIVSRLYARNGLVLATRVSEAGSQALLRAFPEARRYERSGIVVLRKRAPKPRGRVLVVCAGTSDLPVAEEAAVTAETLGSRVEQVADVGVAGLHRLLAHREKLRGARVVVVVAGLEGALPSVVGGLVDRPVIAVPTSVGYGAHFGGLAPLLAMLNSCAPGVTVVNVNNGFGAGYAAHLVNAGSESRPRNGGAARRGRSRARPAPPPHAPCPRRARFRGSRARCAGACARRFHAARDGRSRCPRHFGRKGALPRGRSRRRTGGRGGGDRGPGGARGPARLCIAPAPRRRDGRERARPDPGAGARHRRAAARRPDRAG